MNVTDFGLAAGGTAPEGARPYPPTMPWVDKRDGVVSLTGSRCTECAKSAFPALAECPSCGAAAQPVQLASTGTLYAFTRVHVGRAPFPSTYTLAMVDLEDDVRIVGQVDDDGGLTVGQTVETRLGAIADDAGETVLGYRFAPVGGR